jgi:hypothetical protein
MLECFCTGEGARYGCNVKRHWLWFPIVHDWRTLHCTPHSACLSPAAIYLPPNNKHPRTFSNSAISLNRHLLASLLLAGRYEDELTAAKAYDKAAMYLYGSNAVTNFGLQECLQDTTEVSALLLLLLLLLWVSGRTAAAAAGECLQDTTEVLGCSAAAADVAAANTQELKASVGQQL